MRQCQPYATGDLLLKLQAFDQKHPGTETVLCFRVFLHQFIFFSQKKFLLKIRCRRRQLYENAPSPHLWQNENQTKLIRRKAQSEPESSARLC